MKTLGIIGGMGPMATAYLLELIIQMTAAKTDQEHLSAVVLNNPQVPDRTAYILDRAKPLPCRCWRAWPTPWKTWAAGCCAPPASPPTTSTRSWRVRAGALSPHGAGDGQELQAAGKTRAGILATTGTVKMGCSNRPWRRPA